jgi:chromosome segregation ATPase
MGGRLDGLDKQVERLLEELVRAKTQADLKAESVSDEERGVAKLTQSLAEAEATVVAKTAEMARLQVRLVLVAAVVAWRSGKAHVCTGGWPCC